MLLNSTNPQSYWASFTQFITEYAAGQFFFKTNWFNKMCTDKERKRYFTFHDLPWILIIREINHYIKLKVTFYLEFGIPSSKELVPGHHRYISLIFYGVLLKWYFKSNYKWIPVVLLCNILSHTLQSQTVLHLE